MLISDATILNQTPQKFLREGNGESGVDEKGRGRPPVTVVEIKIVELHLRGEVQRNR